MEMSFIPLYLLVIFSQPQDYHKHKIIIRKRLRWEHFPFSKAKKSSIEPNFDTLLSYLKP